MGEERKEEYIPGTCNLGPEETRRRYRIGYLGFGAMVVVIFILEFWDLPRGFRVFILPPLFYALSGFIQAKNRFCYVYGKRGIYSITGRKHFEKIEDKEALRKDRSTANHILWMVIVGTLVLTAVYMVI